MKQSILILLLTIVFVSCGNDDDNNKPEEEQALPPITEIGANTFGCYIDDILFIPRSGEGGNAVSFYSGYPEPTSYYEIEINDRKSQKTANLLMHIHALDANGIGNYTVNESNGLTNIDGLNHTYMHCRIWRDEAANYQNYVSYENSGTITITNYNLASRLVSGTFSGSVRNFEEPHDTIQITNGRFDFKWDALDEADFP